MKTLIPLGLAVLSFSAVAGSIPDEFRVGGFALGSQEYTFNQG
jgi:hypothetical protein